MNNFSNNEIGLILKHLEMISKNMSKISDKVNVIDKEVVSINETIKSIKINESKKEDTIDIIENRLIKLEKFKNNIIFLCSIISVFLGLMSDKIKNLVAFIFFKGTL